MTGSRRKWREVVACKGSEQVEVECNNTEMESGELEGHAIQCHSTNKSKTSNCKVTGGLTETADGVCLLLC